MNKTICLCFFLLFSYVKGWAQELSPIVWESYYIGFNAPADMRMAEETEEEIFFTNGVYDAILTMIDMEGMNVESMGDELQHLVAEDGVEMMGKVEKIENDAFHIAYLKGKSTDARCLYAYLLAKDESCALMFTIFYKENGVEEIPLKMLKSLRFTE